MILQAFLDEVADFFARDIAFEVVARVHADKILYGRAHYPRSLLSPVAAEEQGGEVGMGVESCLCRPFKEEIASVHREGGLLNWTKAVGADREHGRVLI
jgi:hypothetical protein